MKLLIHHIRRSELATALVCAVNLFVVTLAILLLLSAAAGVL